MCACESVVALAEFQLLKAPRCMYGQVPYPWAI